MTFPTGRTGPATRVAQPPVGPSTDGPAGIEETNAAVVLLLGDRAYKTKKPVDLGFLDFTSVEARRAACECELVLNARLAPDVYLGLGWLQDPAAAPSRWSRCAGCPLPGGSPTSSRWVS